MNKLADGCCSAVTPCSWQQRHPTTICATCRAASPSVSAWLATQEKAARALAATELQNGNDARHAWFVAQAAAYEAAHAYAVVRPDAALLPAAHRETVGEEEIARTILDRRGLGFYTDPMEGGQNAYDISCEALNEAEAILALFQAPRPGETGTQTQAARDVLAERRRQVEAEGWTPAHDDEHNRCELATAAACYATATSPVGIEREWVYPDPPKNWPWHRSWWKPSFYRRNLVKAGALILAEIERWDRAALLTARRAEGEAQRPSSHPAGPHVVEVTDADVEWLAREAIRLNNRTLARIAAALLVGRT